MTAPAEDYLQDELDRLWYGALAAVGVFMFMAATGDMQVAIPLAMRSIHLKQQIVGVGVSIALVASLIWLSWYEWTKRHYTAERRRIRFCSWAEQALVLGIFAFEAHSAREWSRLGFAAGMSIVAGFAWHLWIKFNALSAEDQAELDRVAEEYEEQMVPAVVDRQRRTRFDKAAARYHLTVPDASGLLPLKSIVWSLPSGRHDPKVYFIVHGSRIKIGTTVDVRKRVRALSLRIDNVALLLPGGADVERTYHGKFAALRIDDTEWFTAEPELINFIAMHQPWEQ